MRSKRWVLLVAVVVVAGGDAYRLALARLPDQKDPPPPKAVEAENALKKTMLEDARKLFEQFVKRHQAGVGALAVEELALWSSRWLEAELDLAADATARATALKAHLDRMKDVEKQATALMKTGQGREADAVAGHYHRTQAELWVARGRMR